MVGTSGQAPRGKRSPPFGIFFLRLLRPLSVLSLPGVETIKGLSRRFLLSLEFSPLSLTPHSLSALPRSLERLSSWTLLFFSRGAERPSGPRPRRRQARARWPPACSLTDTGHSLITPNLSHITITRQHDTHRRRGGARRGRGRAAAGTAGSEMQRSWQRRRRPAAQPPEPATSEEESLAAQDVAAAAVVA